MNVLPPVNCNRAAGQPPPPGDHRGNYTAAVVTPQRPAKNVGLQGRSGAGIVKQLAPDYPALSGGKKAFIRDRIVDFG